MKLEFLHESLRDNLAAEPLRPVWEREVGCFSSLPPVWDNTVAFVCERSGHTQPLLFCWRNENASDVLKRRAVQIWSEVGSADDWSDVLDGTSGFLDPLLQDAVGHAVRAVLGRDSGARSGEIYACFRQVSKSDTDPHRRTSAIRILTFLDPWGARADDDAVLASFGSAHRDVRVATLEAVTENRIVTAPLLEAAYRACLDDDPVVRDIAWNAVVSVYRRSPSAELEARLREAIRLYRQQFQQPADEYVLVCWLRRSPWMPWVTQHLVQVACDTSTNEVVRWMALRQLCRYGHRRFLGAHDWNRLEAVQWSEPARLVWNELRAVHRLFDGATHSNNAYWEMADLSSATNNQNDELRVAARPLRSPPVQKFDSRRREAEDLVLKDYRQRRDSAWRMVESAYEFYALPPEHQHEYAEFLCWLLKQQADKDRLRAVSFLGNAGMVNQWLRRLRLESLRHPDAHVRHYSATSTLDFCEHRWSVPFLRHNLIEDENETARWDAGGALITLVGAPALPDVLKAANDDPSPLVRAFLLEQVRFFEDDERVHQAFMVALTRGSDSIERARAIRSYERIGNKRGLPVLEQLFGDNSTTPLGRVGEVAREVHHAIVARLENS